MVNERYNVVLDLFNKIKSEHPLTQGSIEQLK